jgi:hypothetical protein
VILRRLGLGRPVMHQNPSVLQGIMKGFMEKFDDLIMNARMKEISHGLFQSRIFPVRCRKCIESFFSLSLPVQTLSWFNLLLHSLVSCFVESTCDQIKSLTRSSI